MAYTAEQLSDLQCIRDAALRYCRGVDRLDVELMKSAYWEGATDDHGVFVGDAWEFCEMCMEAHLPRRSTNHCILNHAIELLDAHTATGEIYNVTYLFKMTSRCSICGSGAISTSTKSAATSGASLSGFVCTRAHIQHR